MRILAVVWRLVPFMHTVVAQDRSNAQAIIPEYPAPPLCLSHTMFGKIAPVAHGLLVAEEGKRQELARLAQTLEALDGNKAVHLSELSAQLCGDVQIFLLSQTTVRPAS